MTEAASSARGSRLSRRVVPWTVWRRRVSRSERWLPAKPSMPVTRTVCPLAVLRLHHLQPLHAGLRREQIRLVGSLPRQIEVGTPEVAVGRRLLVDRPSELQLANDFEGAQVEVLVDELLDGGDRNPLGAEGFDEDRHRLADADGIGDL